MPSRADPAYQGVNSVVNWVTTCRRLLNVGISYTQRSSSVQGSQIHALHRIPHNLALVCTCPNGLQHFTSRAYIMLGPQHAVDDYVLVCMHPLTLCHNHSRNGIQLSKRTEGFAHSDMGKNATCTTVFQPASTAGVALTSTDLLKHGLSRS